MRGQRNADLSTTRTPSPRGLGNCIYARSDKDGDRCRLAESPDPAMRDMVNVMASTSAIPDTAARANAPSAPSSAVKAFASPMITASRAPNLSTVPSSKGFLMLSGASLPLGVSLR